MCAFTHGLRCVFMHRLRGLLGPIVHFCASAGGAERGVRQFSVASMQHPLQVFDFPHENGIYYAVCGTSYDLPDFGLCIRAQNGVAPGSPAESGPREHRDRRRPDDPRAPLRGRPEAGRPARDAAARHTRFTDGVKNFAGIPWGNTRFLLDHWTTTGPPDLFLMVHAQTPYFYGRNPSLDHWTTRNNNYEGIIIRRGV